MVVPSRNAAVSRARSQVSTWRENDGRLLSALKSMGNRALFRTMIGANLTPSSFSHSARASSTPSVGLVSR